MDNTHEDMRARRVVAKTQNEERAKTHSKKQLIRHVTKKFKTCMIGAIARCEDTMGHLWGHGKPLDELSTEEREWKDKWDRLRDDILNNGNNQLRAALDEISQYDVKWEKFQTEFIIKKD